MSTDYPKSLSDEQVRAARFARLHEPHIKPFTEFVERIRAQTGLGQEIPYFDPLDGGIDALCLFVGEAPGPGAVKSGFVSRNNPDNSARNFFELNQEAGIPRDLTITWNIVPWYIGTGKKIRNATAADIIEGAEHFWELLALLPSLKIVVLSGRSSQGVLPLLERRFPNLELVRMMHTSPLVINTKKENRAKILATLQEVAGKLNAIKRD